MNRVPKEARNGTKKFFTHLKVWMCGICTCPVLVKEEVGQQGGKCIFLGYCDESKAYKLYNPSTKKLIIIRDVQFIGEEALDGSLEKTVNVKTCMSHEEKEEWTAASNSSTMAAKAQQRRPK